MMGKAPVNGQQGTSGVIANMLGLGPVMQTIQDPAFLAHIKSMFDAFAETRERCQRIEQWCMRLSEQIERLEYAGTLAAASVPAVVGTDGGGAAAPTGGVADDGASDIEAEAGGVGERGGRVAGGIAGGAPS